MKTELLNDNTIIKLDEKELTQMVEKHIAAHWLSPFVGRTLQISFEKGEAGFSCQVKIVPPTFES